MLAATYFAADEAQLYYDLKRPQTLPFSCGAPKVFATNVQDIVEMKSDENPEVKLLKINPLDVSYAAEIRSLSLCLRYKLEIMDGSKNSLGAQIICETRRSSAPQDWKWSLSLQTRRYRLPILLQTEDGRA